MAPEYPIFLVVLSLRLEGESLVAEVESIERGGRARIRARWSERRQPAGYRSVGSGVLYVEEAEGVVFPEPRLVYLDDLGDSRFRWIQGTPEHVPWVMIAAVCPHGYTFRQSKPAPTSVKDFNGQVAAYWCLRGNDLGRTRVEWTLARLDRSIGDEVRRLNSTSSLDEVPPVAGIDVDSPSTGGKVSAPLKVFLCHASQDKPRVRDVYVRLRGEGYAPWLDEEDMVPGVEWRSAIRHAVRSSDAVLVCLSTQSVNKTGFLQKEISFVIEVAEEQPEGTLFVIPLRFEAVDVPERLSKWHWLDYFHDGAHERLLRALKKRALQLHPL